MTARIILGAALGLALTSSAFAQSYNAPAGIPAAAAPGGLEGRAALPNLLDAQGRDPRGYAPRGYVVEDGLVTGSLRGQRGERVGAGR
ncbi:hypothetical protein [uncultured Methylobacterium sp.]|uniref:hypothetical protein n=1 Tax=uncultured Methylobacterium sp. TaxID=157278 RepID=UPI0035C9B960